MPAWGHKLIYEDDKYESSLVCNNLVGESYKLPHQHMYVCEKCHDHEKIFEVY